MTDTSPLYLLARMPVDVRGAVCASNDRGQPGWSPIEDGRLHITMAVLHAIDAPQEHVVQLIRWILSTIPPFAFRVAFDELIVSATSTLLRASNPLHGAIACQAHIAAMLRDYGVALPKRAMPVPQVTLGYGGCAPAGVRGIDTISWLADELVLVRGVTGQRRHDVLGRWCLPVRPDVSRDRQAAARAARPA